MRARLRTDRGLLVLTAGVVAVVSALLTAVWPLTVRTADEAVSDAVGDAGAGAAVVATVPPAQFRGDRRRDPDAVERFGRAVEDARSGLPDRLRAVLRPSVASLSSPALRVSGPGASRSLRLVYAQSPTAPPAVTWVAGRAPGASVGAGRADVVLDDDDPPWPVEVGLSERAALLLDLLPGATLTLEDEYGQDVAVRISGIYSPDDPGDPAWDVARELLSPAVAIADGVERTSAGALVTAAALPDLRIAVPADELTQRTTFLPDPERLGWRGAPELRREVVSLKAVAGAEVEWDSVLDRLLADAEQDVADARGQAQLLLVGLVASAGLTLALVALLLGRRRAGPLVLARERGAALPGLAAELGVESVLVAAAGALAGTALTLALLGDVGWRWLPPVVVVVALAAPVAGAVEAARATSARRVPANRAARRVADGRRRSGRALLELAVLAVAVLASVALRQRGSPEGDLTPSSAPTWWAVVGAVALLRLLPGLSRLAMRGVRRSRGRLSFFVAARVAAGGLRALPLAVLVVAVSQLVLGSGLAATQQRGQEAGALLTVGGDARLKTAPGPDVDGTAADLGRAPGVRAGVAGRVADRTLASAASTGATVRLVVVDAGAYRDLLARSDLPDAPQLGRLESPADPDAPVPALLSGGPPGLADGLRVRWGEDLDVALDVVGAAPLVEGGTDPVVLVDATAFAAAGAESLPDTVWAVGPGASDALRAYADQDPSVTLLTYDEVLAGLRDDPLREALVDLAVVASALLLLLAALGVVLGTAVGAPARDVSLGRLRALGLPDRGLRAVLAGELLVPVLAAVLTGTAVGVLTLWANTGSLDLAAVTGQDRPPALVVPVWTWLAAGAVLLVPLVLALRLHRRLRRASLARVLRSG
ncbi:ABC transporter permease [Nocardioides anomalus]|uniref:ABC transporter permease n=1 Tax=Nocardioides anomalus TaxID=2712223 RepID=A0A6G6W8B6_9ACTN|nr:ABC transporter permease [Nocardioides anomalus]QIG41355.1 ABC transporter permease [Nocardioides anomalus]